MAAAPETRVTLGWLQPIERRLVRVEDILGGLAIAALAAAPVDTYGVGTRVVTGSGHPTASMVYKLVVREDDEGRMIGVAKKSKDKQSVGGRKYALRRRNPLGVAEAEVLGIGEQPVGDGDDRDLLVRLVEGGEVRTGAHHLAAPGQPAQGFQHPPQPRAPAPCA